MFTADFTIPVPVRPGYEFLGWSVSGKSGLYKNYTVKKGTTGWLGLTANWAELPEQQYTFELMANAINTKYDGVDDDGNKYIIYSLGDGIEDTVDITYYASEGVISLTRLHIEEGDTSVSITGVSLDLTAKGSKFYYSYLDYSANANNEKVALIADGQVYGSSYTFNVYGGDDAGSSTLVSAHEDVAGGYIWDICHVLDAFCEDFVSKNCGASSFGLTYN